MSRTISIDTADLDIRGTSGALWSLPHDGDLDANVVLLQPGRSVGAHVNGEVDVLIVGITGTGEVLVDGVSHALRAAVGEPSARADSASPSDSMGAPWRDT